MEFRADSTHKGNIVHKVVDTKGFDNDDTRVQSKDGEDESYGCQGPHNT